MSKHSKRRKLNRLSSSSGEEETGSNCQNDASKRKSHKRKNDEMDPKSSKKEQKKSHQVDSHSSRQIAKPVYRLSTKKEEQKVSPKEEQLKNNGPLQLHMEGQSSISRTTREIKTVRRDQSKPNKASCAALLTQTIEKKLEDKSDKKCSQGSYSELKNEQISNKLDAAEHRDHRQGSEKRNGSAREPSRSPHDSRNTKTQEPISSHYKHFQKWSNMARDQNTSKNYPYSRSTSVDAKNPPTSVTQKSCISPKPSMTVTNPKKWKSFTSTPVSNKSEPPPSTLKQMGFLKCLPFKLNFKIPKHSQPALAHSSLGNNNTVSSNQNLKLKDNKDGSGAKKLEPAKVEPCRLLAGSSNSPCKVQSKRSSLPDRLPSELHPAGDAKSEQFFDQGQVVEELHLARSEKRLEVNVKQSYGELTGMDIDSAEEGAAETNYRDPKQKTLILVLDTNILLSHLDYVKKIRSCGLEALGFPIVLIPWVVLQELDSLKNRKGLSGSVAHLATPAISFIYTSLKKRDPHLWGQSMQQATEISNGLNTKNNDDRVLQCCLQYQNMYPECVLILCTNDKNLSNKAVLSGVTALSKVDLEAGVRRSKHGHQFLLDVQSPVPSRLSHNISSPALSTSCSPACAQLPVQDSAGFPLDTPRKGPPVKFPSVKKGHCQEAEWDLSAYLCELEDSLRDVLSEVLETEMKAAYDELWQEIVYIKPPWSLQDVLQCFKKHWIAVFGQLVPRKMLETVGNLINFFSSGETISTLWFLQKTKELVKAFRKSSERVPGAITVIEDIINKVQSQHDTSGEQELSAGDVVMNDDESVDKQPGSPHFPPQEVWAVFENIWSQVYQTSLEVFKALSFDPLTMQAATPMGRPPPPQDALACLHRLSSMVSQLLQAFGRVLSSTPGLEEVQTLLSIIYSNKLVSEETRLTTKDLLDCFSQPDYREKLGVGGNQLLELKKALDGCVQTTGQNFAFTAPC
ncbi:transcriptional protein SWT1 isoform X1 [Poecilia formosa]|uniref:Transcriptional protein SWT1 n=1 Tax=Poecilia formosa TaxID=48698 RepID=A0A087XYX3_POEFO|nr:PREDICTED: transcriptional protein SWT1 isoform X1 [Poecilia formosa]XP_016526286.1 PREDICTED: transcriptional protein SWT1 isoform X1 [Poecilia formosa]